MKKRYLSAAAAALMVSVLAGCGAPAKTETAAGSAAAETNAAVSLEETQKALSSPGGEDGVFTIAYAPNESTTDSADARKGLAKDLKEVLGCDVEEIQASDYNAIIEALRTGKADMAYMGSQAIALGAQRTDLTPIVMKAEDGDTEKAIYHSVFIAKGDNSEINSIEDIKGKTMAFVDPDSTSGNLVPTAEIIKAFPDDQLNSDILHTNGAFFEAVSFSGSHQAGLQAVIKGDIDVAPISDQILASEIANGKAGEGDVKVIHTSGSIPAEAMVVNAEVDEETREALTEFLISYDNPAYFKDVIKVPNARFIKCSIADYEPIIELNRIINES